MTTSPNAPSLVLPDERLATGANPGTDVEPEIAQVLAEIGVEPRDAYPKPLTDEVVQATDVVVTMGCGDACPVVPGHRYLDWPVPDPDHAPIAVVRQIRDEIDTHITNLLTIVP